MIGSLPEASKKRERNRRWKKRKGAGSRKDIKGEEEGEDFIQSLSLLVTSLGDAAWILLRYNRRAAERERRQG
jgi:hypothetical protein